MEIGNVGSHHPANRIFRFMNKVSKSLIVLFLAFLIGSGFSVMPVQAQNNNLILGVVEQCDIQYAGDSCIAELKLTNNTGKILDGRAVLHIDYKGVCSNNNLENFDGEGIQAWYNDSPPSSGWNNGDLIFSDFNINKGETYPKLKIKTVPNLCPGEYTFTFSIKGIFEERGYVAPSVIVGGLGYIPPVPTTPITDNGKVTATPGEGGITSLTNPDGSKIKLTIPAGAVSENTHFTIERVDINLVTPPSPESGLFLVNGLVYEIKAEVNGKSITTFKKPLILTFTYTNEQIEGLDENSLKIYYWNGKNWIALENSEVNRDDNTVTASTDHFTLFALIGSKIELIKEEIGPSEITKEISKKITEEVIPPKEEVTSSKEEVVPPKEGIVTVPPEERVAGEGLASLLLASLGEIGETPWMAIIVVFCIIGLVIIGIREWELARKKKKQI